MSASPNDTHPPRQWPWILYGTAWKEERTEALTLLALRSGFRGIDTANQRKHYFEEGVGKALATWFREDGGHRDQLFLQTKYTFASGQDHRLPYDPRAPIGTQVEQSLASSLGHLGVDAVDSLVLHGPSQRMGWGARDTEAYRAMERLAQSGKAVHLGVSNVDADQLRALLKIATKPPRFVQNRCYAVLGWDREVRAVCRDHAIVYQGFSLLTANQPFLRRPECHDMARRRGITLAQLVFGFSRALGMVPLTGTTNETHMREDLQTPPLELTPNEWATFNA